MKFLRNAQASNETIDGAYIKNRNHHINSMQELVYVTTRSRVQLALRLLPSGVLLIDQKTITSLQGVFGSDINHAIDTVLWMSSGEDLIQFAMIPIAMLWIGKLSILDRKYLLDQKNLGVDTFILRSGTMTSATAFGLQSTGISLALFAGLDEYQSMTRLVVLSMILLGTVIIDAGIDAQIQKNHHSHVHED